MNKQTVVITNYKNRLLALFLKDGQCIQAQAFARDEILGNIYLARVVKNVPNIRAIFADIAPGQPVYLPYENLLPDRGIPAQGMEIPVKVIKDGVKTKEPTADMHLSIDGSYCVVTLDRPQTISYSNKLSKAKKDKIHAYLQEHLDLADCPYGFIIRTSAGMLTEYTPIIEEIRKNMVQLKNTLQYASSRTCYSLLYQGETGYLSFLYHLKLSECDRIVTDEPQVYQSLFTSDLPQEHKAKLELYQDSFSLTKLYSIDTKIERILSRKLWLSSGASIYIEPTEALTVIDVNTGKCIAKKNKAALIKSINLEAIDEICSQLILRNISGIIVIDFLKMEKSDEEEVLGCLKRKLREDPVKSDFVDITPLGLVELTRKKIRKSFYEQLTD